MWRWWKNKKNKWKDRLTSSQLTKVQRCRYEWLLMPVGWSGEVSRPQHFPQNQVVLFLQSSIFFHDCFFFFIENPKTLRVLHYSEMEDMDSTVFTLFLRRGFEFPGSWILNRWGDPDSGYFHANWLATRLYFSTTICSRPEKLIVLQPIQPALTSHLYPIIKYKGHFFDAGWWAQARWVPPPPIPTMRVDLLIVILLLLTFKWWLVRVSVFLRVTAAQGWLVGQRLRTAYWASLRVRFFKVVRKQIISRHAHNLS